MTAKTEKIQPPTQSDPQNGSEIDSPIVDPPEISSEKPSSPDITPDPQNNPNQPGQKISLPHLERILNMKVPVIIKIAQKKMHLRDILKLNLGTVIQFEQDAYRYVDLMVNNSTIGLGQTVKVGENFGLKISQIGDITDTIKSLGKSS
ncbi:MAG: FliM/FliN family flagellar motor switch protein [Sedimentisphaerales bacterium]|nr:FliM/FliN family flagellar motor switch protein [Sedimentisphaerales bacterium]